MKTDELKQWLAERKEAGKAIDVATCEINWTYGDLCSFAPPKATAGFRRTTCQRKARSLCTSASMARAYRRSGRSERRRKPQPSEVEPRIPDVRNSRRRNTSDLCVI